MEDFESYEHKGCVLPLDLDKIFRESMHPASCLVINFRTPKALPEELLKLLLCEGEVAHHVCVHLNTVCIHIQRRGLCWRWPAIPYKDHSQSDGHRLWHTSKG